MANGPGLPPATFDFKPALYRLTSGQKLYRIERGLKYVGKFNNRPDINNRFSSIFDSGKIIPTIYCAQSIEAAIFESILRDTPTQTNRVISKSTFEDQYVTEVDVMASLQLISLRGAGLKKLGLMEKQMIHCGPKVYDQTRAWAESLYSQSLAAQGLIWTSRQLGPEFSVVLFESRVHKSDLKFSRSPILIKDTIDIYDFAYRHGIWIN